MKKISEIIRFAWRSGLTTIAGIQANLDGLLNPSSKKDFVNAFLLVILYTMLPDDTIGKTYDALAKRATKTDDKSETLPPE